MTDLYDAASTIYERGRNAGHTPGTVHAALRHVHQAGGDVNAGQQMLNEFRSTRVPRWLVDRWAHDAGLVDTASHRHLHS